ncbi:trehalose-phosphatase [Rhodococcus sp. IEGM 1408]|uniref:trehalose-phosphatase n=1 Tax=Rhodococcus sp. IEGM 1408 TaxID=3082220 RepID=UPI002955DE73|nr:trehalose-phosphatase [Rhodococcus sp. IEGM 1408]MDV8002352.1 trehalose-phosphatase [Rhodococcus sp. IEGM 1408]
MTAPDASTSDNPSPELDDALRRAAQTPTLVIACDYDGTLAPFVDDPTRAVPAPGAIAALERLAGLPRTTVALLSGRNRAALAQVSGAGAPVVLVGSHGSEWEGGFDTPLDDDEVARLARVTADLEEVASRTPGAHVELKPTAAVLHVRPVSDPAQRETAMAEAMAGPAALDGVFVTEGKNVVEIAVREASKGAAIERLVKQTGAEVAVFIGDDVTDERGFARLRDQDIGVKVGDGQTLAGHRVADIPAVVGLLEQLARLRA